MNQSSVEAISDRAVYLVFKGTFLYLAPLTIPLSLIVVIQNIVNFINYYKDRNMLIPSLFMGIALSDILRAQGELVLSVISILAYTGLVDVTVLYKSLVFYMLTALPGVNWSKVFNLVMTISITINVSNPFHRINFPRLRKIVTCLCFAIMMLHVADAITVIACEYKPIYPDFPSESFIYLYLQIGFILPGVPTAAAVYCKKDDSGLSRCDDLDSYLAAFLYVIAAIYFLGPPIVMLTCMIIQVIYLRRSLQEQEEDEVTPLMPNTARHVSITVFSISLLFFICNSAYILNLLVFWLIADAKHYDEKGYTDKDIADMGVLLGFTEFTLPLIYAVLYPVILICRKEELRRRYVGYWRRLTAWCRLVRNEEETEGLNN